MTTTKKANLLNTPLPILYSCRVRLTEEQRLVLRTAHTNFRKQFAAPQQQPVMAGSTLSVTTTTTIPTNAYAEAGMSDLVVSDLIGTRDSIPLNILLKIENLLGVKVVTRKMLEEKFADYLTYLEV